MKGSSWCFITIHGRYNDCGFIITSLSHKILQGNKTRLFLTFYCCYLLNLFLLVPSFRAGCSSTVGRLSKHVIHVALGASHQYVQDINCLTFSYTKYYTIWFPCRLEMFVQIRWQRYLRILVFFFIYSFPNKFAKNGTGCITLRFHSTECTCFHLLQ